MKSVLGLLLASTSTALIACQGQETKYVETKVPVIVKENSEVITSEEEPTKKEFSAIIDQTYDGKIFTVSIKSTHEDLHIIEIKRANNAKQEDFVGLSVTDSTEFIDKHTSDSNDLLPWDYSYEFIMDHPSFESPRKYAFTITQKKDLTLENSQELKSFVTNASDIQLRTLTLKNSATLTLNYSRVRLHAEELIAERGAKIETLSEETAQKAAPEAMPGIDGGDISLIFDIASGDLDIYMRGGKGGKGQRGADSEVTGSTGAKGDDERAYYEPPRLPGREVLIKPSPKMGVWYHICERPATNGSNGGQGGTGGSGRQGGRGGTAGRVEITIKKGHLNYSVTQQPGEGGNGGDGGQGGPGGVGGAAGVNRVCRQQASAGATGPQGAQGPTGPSGNKGSYGTFCHNSPTTTACPEGAISQGAL